MLNRCASVTILCTGFCNMLLIAVDFWIAPALDFLKVPLEWQISLSRGRKIFFHFFFLGSEDWPFWRSNDYIQLTGHQTVALFFNCNTVSAIQKYYVFKAADYQVQEMDKYSYKYVYASTLVRLTLK